MRTVFTSEDTKRIISAAYSSNDEEVVFIDEETKAETKSSLAEYLNIEFYTWKNRIVSASDNSYNSESEMSVFDSWVESLNLSMNKAYALVETLNEEVTTSQTLDYSTIMGKTTFLIQSNKVKNLEYYNQKVRNSLLGAPQELQNSYGDKLTAFVTVGILLYEDEPFQTQLGECVKVSCNFRIVYMQSAKTFSDYTIKLSFDNLNYYDIVPTKMTWQNVFISKAVPTTARPDLSGVVITSLSASKTISFFDFNTQFSKELEDIFFRNASYEMGNNISTALTTIQEINIPIYVKLTKLNALGETVVYVYKDVIEQMEKVMSNNDFTVSSLTLRTYANI